jgi:hypothetical protein
LSDGGSISRGLSWTTKWQSAVEASVYSGELDDTMYLLWRLWTRRPLWDVSTDGGFQWDKATMFRDNMKRTTSVERCSSETVIKRFVV